MAEAIFVVLQHDKSLAHDLYPVSQALAAKVVDGCSMVTCWSISDLAALLDSPRWGAKKWVTALYITDRQPEQYPGQPALLPAAEAESAIRHPLRVWVKTAATDESSINTPAEDAAAFSTLAPKCPDLQHLEVKLSHLGPAVGTAVVCAAPHWPSLQYISLNGTRQLAQRLKLPANLQQPLLQGFYVSDNDICMSPEAAEMLAAAGGQHWKDLQHLDLSDNAIGPTGAAALAAAGQRWTKLRHLALRNTRIGSEGAAALASAAQHWKQLQHLNLSDSSLGHEGVAALASAAQHWKQLQHLDLSDNSLGPEGTAALASAAEHWPQLQHLNLSSNRLGPGGAAALATAAEHLTQLQHLDLYWNWIQPEGAQSLVAAAQHWTQLQHLNLRGNSISPTVAEALLTAAPHWQHLSENWTYFGM